jgi:hypothetical protein
MKKGLIFSARHNSPDAIHPIIFWEMQNQFEFVGLMLTHAKEYGNIDLSDNSYFYEKHADFSDTYMVQTLLLKPSEWLTKPKKKGQLSKKGIMYVEGLIAGMQPISWNSYITR